MTLSELRASLGEWVARARNGTEILVTDRGVAVARISGIDEAATIDRLVDLGHVSRPRVSGPRPIASERRRPGAKESISDLVSDQRR